MISYLKPLYFDTPLPDRIGISFLNSILYKKAAS